MGVIYSEEDNNNIMKGLHSTREKIESKVLKVDMGKRTTEQDIINDRITTEFFSALKLLKVSTEVLQSDNRRRSKRLEKDQVKGKCANCGIELQKKSLISHTRLCIVKEKSMFYKPKKYVFIGGSFDLPSEERDQHRNYLINQYYTFLKSYKIEKIPALILNDCRKSLKPIRNCNRCVQKVLNRLAINFDSNSKKRHKNLLVRNRQVNGDKTTNLHEKQYTKLTLPTHIPCVIRGCNQILRIDRHKLHLINYHNESRMSTCKFCRKTYLSIFLPCHNNRCSSNPNNKNSLRDLDYEKVQIKNTNQVKKQKVNIYKKPLVWTPKDQERKNIKSNYTEINNRYQCDFQNCKRQFLNKKSMHTHLLKVHSPQVICPVNGCRKLNPYSMVKHVWRIHKQPCPLKTCKVCGILLLKCGLITHMRARHK